jgi:glyceraldehyde 3-phosphate dehydrogenase
MTIRVGINGFGRMGRLGLRAGWSMSGYDIVRINEIATDAYGSAHLLKFDSVHGTWHYDTESQMTDAKGSKLIINDHSLVYTSNTEIAETDWSDCDIVIEATGKHHKKPETVNHYFELGK